MKLYNYQKLSFLDAFPYYFLQNNTIYIYVYFKTHTKFKLEFINLNSKIQNNFKLKTVVNYPVLKIKVKFVSNYCIFGPWNIWFQFPYLTYNYTFYIFPNITSNTQNILKLIKNFINFTFRINKILDKMFYFTKKTQILTNLKQKIEL